MVDFSTGTEVGVGALLEQVEHQRSRNCSK